LERVTAAIDKTCLRFSKADDSKTESKSAGIGSHSCFVVESLRQAEQFFAGVFAADGKLLEKEGDEEYDVATRILAKLKLDAEDKENAKHTLIPRVVGNASNIPAQLRTVGGANTLDAIVKHLVSCDPSGPLAAAMMNCIPIDAIGDYLDKHDSKKLEEFKSQLAARAETDSKELAKSVKRADLKAASLAKQEEERKQKAERMSLAATAGDDAVSLTPLSLFSSCPFSLCRSASALMMLTLRTERRSLTLLPGTASALPNVARQCVTRPRLYSLCFCESW
jgi:hypothetical protein